MMGVPASAGRVQCASLRRWAHGALETGLVSDRGAPQHCLWGKAESPGPVFANRPRPQMALESTFKLPTSELRSRRGSTRKWRGVSRDAPCLCAVVDSRKEATVTAAPPRALSPTLPPPLADEAPEEELDCMGTGISVECVVHNADASIVQLSSKDSAQRAASDKTQNGAAKAANGTFIANPQAPSSDSVADGAAKAALATREFLEDSTRGDPLELLAAVGSTLLLISPFFFWGSSMVAMKDVLPRAGPMFVAAIRLIPAGALLVAFASSRGRAMPSSPMAWAAILAFAAVDATCFQGFLTEGLRRTSAGLGSVIIDSQPLTVAVLAAALFGEQLAPRGVVGLLLGVLGLCLLEIPGDTIQSTLEGGLAPLLGATSTIGDATQALQAGGTGLAGVESDWNVWESGEWWMLLAAQSMALGTVMVRWVCRHCDPIMATGWHLMLGGLPLLALSAVQHDPALQPGGLAALSVLDWSLLGYTSIFGSAVSYGVFFYNAQRGNLTRLSSLTFLTPAFAALFGFMFLDETLNMQQIGGALVTVLAIYLVNTQQADNKA